MTEETKMHESLAQAEVDYDRAPGHWILARMGKRVLRPGGRELTEKLVDALNVSPDDDVVEFAPGLGFTAGLVLQRRPRSYIGIERDDAAAAETRRILSGASQCIVVGDVLRSGLDDACASVVYGEAMLTMQADSHKLKIMQEAARLLRPGGRYGIHELCLRPEDIAPEQKQSVQRDLAHAIRVNARPLTVSEWQAMLAEAGLRVEATFTNPMHLLKPVRIVADEGLARALRIAFNILRTPAARRRILQMRAVFNRYADHLGAVAIVAVKR